MEEANARDQYPSFFEEDTVLRQVQEAQLLQGDVQDGGFSDTQQREEQEDKDEEEAVVYNTDTEWEADLEGETNDALHTLGSIDSTGYEGRNQGVTLRFRSSMSHIQDDEQQSEVTEHSRTGSIQFSQGRLSSARSIGCTTTFQEEANIAAGVPIKMFAICDIEWLYASRLH